MQSKREHKAKLYFGGARCGSACVYAMVGASTRHVDPGATLRIHSGVGHEFDKTENFLRRYVIGMGVDPALSLVRGVVVGPVAVACFSSRPARHEPR